MTKIYVKNFDFLKRDLFCYLESWIRKRTRGSQLKFSYSIRYQHWPCPIFFHEGQDDSRDPFYSKKTCLVDKIINFLKIQTFHPPLDISDPKYFALNQGYLVRRACSEIFPSFQEVTEKLHFWDLKTYQNEYCSTIASYEIRMGEIPNITSKWVRQPKHI